LTSRAVVHVHVVSPAAPGNVAKPAHHPVEVVMIGNRRVMETTVGLDGMTIDIHTDLHGEIVMTEKKSTHAVAVAVAHARRIPAAVNHATNLAVLHGLEKSGDEIVRARDLEENDASATGHQHVAATVLALGVPITLIAMYQVAVVQPVLLPVNAKTAGIASGKIVGLASVRIVDLANGTIAVTVHGVIVLETTTVGMAVENEEVGV